MSVIREDDVIASVADALQYISYYHTPDFIRAMGHAYAIEKPTASWQFAGDRFTVRARGMEWNLRRCVSRRNST
jgi:hypothetical protein